MTGVPPLEIYDAYHDEIQAIFRSRLLTQVLIALGSGSRSLPALRDATGSSSQALIPKIRQLEALQYVEQVRGDYVLTPIGRLVEPEIERLVTLMGVLGRHREFWVEHELDSIPPESLGELRHLYNAMVIRDVEEDIYAVHAMFAEIIRKASWVHGVSSIMSPVQANLIEQVIIENKPVELVVSPEIAGKLAKEPYRATLESLKEYSRAVIYVSPAPFRLGMAVTESCLSLGLYRRDTGTYDTASDLVSSDPAAVAWGERVFRHYRAIASPLSIPPDK
ncbi:helix-turn-helix transcriptional regulator [Methanoculleus caldifontis]|nr:transcriptional regulator FilR1 domain-containing protein [Methanoculleus sp. Wushi-C6]